MQSKYRKSLPMSKPRFTAIFPIVSYAISGTKNIPYEFNLEQVFLGYVISKKEALGLFRNVAE